MAGWMALARHLGTASLAGVVAGVLVGGLLGRVVMRVSGFTAGPALVGVRTAGGNRVGEITFEGTLALVLFTGLASGVFGGFVYAIVEPWLRRVRPWHGVAYGAALLLAFGFFVLDPSNFDFTRFGMPLLNVAMFAALFVIFGLAIGWLFDALGALRERTGAAARVVDILAWLALVPAVAAVVLFVGGVAGLDPLTAIVIVAVLLVPAVVRWRGLPLAIGYASLAAVLLLGAARTLSGLPELLAGF
jgi:lysylphosphatidylglycerol synthetase-like protein (DUF2156 family)